VVPVAANARPRYSYDDATPQPTGATEVKLITRQTVANELADRFKEWEKQQTTYIPILRGRGLGMPVEELNKLGPNPDPDACDAVIRQQIDMHKWPSGKTPTWTDVPTCDECGQSKDAVVRVGEEPDYESSTAFVCRDCLSEALGLVGHPVSRLTDEERAAIAWGIACVTRDKHAAALRSLLERLA